MERPPVGSFAGHLAFVAVHRVGESLGHQILASSGVKKGSHHRELVALALVVQLLNGLLTEPGGLQLLEVLPQSRPRRLPQRRISEFQGNEAKRARFESPPVATR